MKCNIPESFLHSTINTSIQIIDNREDNRLNKNQQKEKNERITSIYPNLATLSCWVHIATIKINYRRKI
jgi:hypothetical protein